MSVIILRGDARNLPLPDGCVDLICTSPPYFALRSYTDDGQHYEGQIGSEPTPAEFLKALWECTAEMMRVLKPSGSIFINLGDSYARQGQDKPQTFVSGDVRKAPRQRLATNNGVPLKSLQLIPERYRIGCVDRLGLIARAVIVWHKPNGLPESVTDRVRRSHEDWVHLTKQPRYYSAVDEIRQGYAPDTAARYASGYHFGANQRVANGQHNNAAFRSMAAGDTGPTTTNPLGKLPGSVWAIPTEPLTVPPHLGIDHFAAFPTEWPKRIIRGWSPPGICTACGQGRRPVTTSAETSRVTGNQRDMRRSRAGDATWSFAERTTTTTTTTTIVGYVCACCPHTDHPGSGESSGADGRYGDALARGDGYPTADTDTNGKGLTSLQNRPKVGPWREYHFDRWTPAPTRPAIVLDPFSGTGTSVLVASALGRIGIGVDLSFDYCRLAQWRTHDRAQIAKVLEVPKPPPVSDTQTAFNFEDAS